MTIRELATHYLRYYAAPGEIAANAPEEVRRFVRALPRDYDRNSIHNAFAHFAGKPQQAAVDPAAPWLAARPDTWRFCDSVLGSKKPPKTWAELLDRAYALAQQDTLDTVRKFLRDRIESF